MTSRSEFSKTMNHESTTSEWTVRQTALPSGDHVVYGCILLSNNEVDRGTLRMSRFKWKHRRNMKKLQKAADTLNNGAL